MLPLIITHYRKHIRRWPLLLLHATFVMLWGRRSVLGEPLGSQDACAMDPFVPFQVSAILQRIYHNAMRQETGIATAASVSSSTELSEASNMGVRVCSLMQVFNGSLETCPTCFFPTYPGIEAIKPAAYKLMDFSNKWVYFFGDITVRQMYGEFAAIVHRAQVRTDLSYI